MKRFEHPIHEPPKSFLWKYIFSYDHKIIGLQFLWFSLFFLLVGGSMAMLMRWQLAYPGQPVPLIGKFLFPDGGGAMAGDQYNIAITIHGTIMVFFAIAPLLAGVFGNYLIPLQIGARDMAFPFLNMLSFWTLVPAGMLLLGSLFVEGGGAQAGWTAYPPLSTVGTPGLGQNLWILSLALAGAASIMGGVNYITTIVLYRAPGMTMMRLPLTIWGLFLTAVLNVLYIPVIASGLLMLLMDRVLMTTFFTTGVLATANGYAPGGQVLLYQHVFWVFGHPEVYILILPAWGIMGDILSTFSRKPAFGYRLTVISLCTISTLSAIVWGHHMFVSGMNPFLGRVFGMTTFLVSIPSAILFLNWLLTLWKGSIRLRTPMLFVLGVIGVFGLGGLTGLFNGDATLDIYLHDSYWVVGHFHYTMAASAFMGGLAAIYFWFPKMFGRKMNDTLGKIHFVITVTMIVFLFGGMMKLGAAGHMRRVAEPGSYDFLKHLMPLNKAISHAAFTLFASQVIFAYNFFSSMLWGEEAGNNPWEAATLEWSTTSPPPVHNFDVTPTVYHGPHEYSNPLVTDKDWLGQWEPIPGTQVATSSGESEEDLAGEKNDASGASSKKSAKGGE
jgi:cytochrome c oxidase subunit 1